MLRLFLVLIQMEVAKVSLAFINGILATKDTPTTNGLAIRWLMMLLAGTGLKPKING